MCTCPMHINCLHSFFAPNYRLQVQEHQTPYQQDFLHYSAQDVSFMSQIAALAAAHILPQAALPLIQGSAAPQTQRNAAPTSSTQDTVSISSEAQELQAAKK